MNKPKNTMEPSTTPLFLAIPLEEELDSTTLALFKIHQLGGQLMEE